MKSFKADRPIRHLGSLLRRPTLRRRVWLPATALLLIVALSCSKDVSVAPSIQKIAQRPVNSLSMTEGDETITIDGQTNTLSWADGTSLQVPADMATDLATVIQAVNNHTVAQIEAQVGGGGGPCPDGCPDPYDKRTKRPGQRGVLGPDRGITLLDLQRSEAANKAKASKIRIRKGSAHTHAASISRGHRLRRDGLARFASNVPCATASFMAYMDDPPTCPTIANAIYEETQVYENIHELDNAYLLTTKMKQSDYTLAVSSGAPLEEQQQKAQIVATALGALRAHLREENESLQRLKVSASYYHDSSCWNPSSSNWPLGGDNSVPGGSGFQMSCSWQLWQISFDAGANWEDIVLWTCYIYAT